MRYLRLSSLVTDMVMVIGPADDVTAERLRGGTEAPPGDLTGLLEQDGALRMEHYTSEAVE